VDGLGHEPRGEGKEGDGHEEQEVQARHDLVGRGEAAQDRVWTSHRPLIVMKLVA
jgi:hypothetical protein